MVTEKHYPICRFS